MKVWKQLLRQPLKSIFGLFLMTLAASVVCLCVGQALAAQVTKEILDQQFSAVGIPLVQEDLDGNVTQDSFLLEEEFLNWLEGMAVQNPETVRLVARHGSLSACIPELTPLNAVEEKYTVAESPWYSYQPFPDAMPYSCAMLVITLDSIGEPEPVVGSYPVENLSPEDFIVPEDYETWLYEDPETEKKTAVEGYTVTLSGTVTEVVSLAEGYRDPVGATVHLRFTAPTLEEINGLDLVCGEKYLVFGMDYADEHWKLVSALNPDGYSDYLNLDVYDPKKLRLLTEEEKRENAAWADAFPEDLGELRYHFAVYAGFTLTQEQYLQLNAVSMTLDMPIPLTPFEQVRDPRTGELLELRPAGQVSYQNAAGETVVCSTESYISRYQIPTIARLEGTTEAFLNSPQGTRWKNTLDRCAVNQQAFLAVGVDKMDYLAEFSLKRAQITAGRDFTAEEYTQGSRVCILHDSLAQENGIGLGDTVTLQLYATDYGSPYRQFPADGKGILNPSPSFYSSNTPFVETAEYTVVGFWHGQTIWPDVARVSEYAFSPNTVFVPKSSVQYPMEESDSILFNTLVLENNQIGAFHQLAMNAGYAGRFKYNDQDYATVAANFHNYDALAREILAVGAVIYGVLLLLFLLLYPASQKNTVRTMRSFGAGFFRRFWYVLVSSVWILLPASLLGGWIAEGLWAYLVAALQNTAQSAVQLQIRPGMLTAVGFLQAVFSLVLVTLTAVLVAVPRGLHARR